jgi:hypothetical protein
MVCEAQVGVLEEGTRSDGIVVMFEALASFGKERRQGQ